MKKNERIQKNKKSNKIVILLSTLLFFFTLSVQPANVFVTTLTDENDGGSGGTGMSLRDAISSAIAGDTILFNVTGTITLSNSYGSLNISKNLTVSGPGAHLLTINGNNNQRVFSITAGTVTISDVHITNGHPSSGNGGGVNATGGTVTLTRCAVTSNQVNAACYGAGVATTTSLTLNYCQISNNSCPTGGDDTQGGGVYVANTTANMTGCTVYGNTANYGGGVYGGSDNNTTINLNACTIANNTAATDAGGILADAFWTSSGRTTTITIRNCIIANNTDSDLYATQASAPNLYAAPGLGTANVTSNDYNLIGTVSGWSGAANDLLNTSPNFNSFGSNGGPTQTYSLNAGSSAVNRIPSAGSYNSAPSTDQRGWGRTGNYDVGAYEYTGPEPEINLQGNANTITSGDVTPTTGDHTDFGSVPLSGSTLTRTFTIQNTGTGPLSVYHSWIDGTNAADFTITSYPSSSVSASSSTTVNVQFDPSSTGLRQATLHISGNDNDESHYTFAIQGTGSNEPEMSVEGNSTEIADGDATPSSSDHTDFGNADITSGSVVRTFTIRNTGSANLNLTGTPLVAVGGTHAADFTVTADPSTPVAASGTTTFQVTFDPSATGTRSATISIDNNDTDENPYNFSIQGNGTTPPSAPTATAASSIAATSFSANWNSSSGATGYYLDVATDSGFTSYVTGWQNVDVSNVTTYSVNSNISAGNTYYYRVRAYNTYGTSGNSNTITVLTVPPAPTATAATSITTTSFSANWNAATGATGYYLDVAADSGFTSYVTGWQNVDVSNVTTYSVNSNISAGNTYYYRVRAYNGSGTGGNSNTITVVSVPPAPTATAATSITNTSFSANWNAATGAAGYYLDVAADSGFTSYVTGWQNVDVSNVTTYSVNSNISGGSTYYYRVRAYNANGTGGNSNTITVLTVPPAPTATAATSITASSFSANWNAAAGATGYYLDVAADSGFTSYVTGWQNVDVSNVTTYSVNSNISGGSTYYYRVRAYNGSGTSSNSNTITVLSVPPAPTATAATSITATSFSANWNAATGATGYYLDVAADSGFTSYVTGWQNVDVSNVTTYSVNSNISAGNTYYYRVRAYNANGTGGNSNTITVITVPPAPTATAATSVTASSFSANWTAAAGATGYYLDVAADSGFTSYVTGWQNVDVSNVTTYSVNSNINAGTPYYYRVRAYNANGTSGNSNTISLTTTPTVPTATAATSITASSFSANWNAATGAAGYYLDVATDSGFTSYVTGWQNVDVSNVTTYSVSSNINAGSTYYYRVRAYNTGGTSGNSNTITVLTIPPAPVATAATNLAATSFSANWNTASSAAGYYLDVANDSGFTSYVTGWQNVDVGNVTTYSVNSNITTGNTYYYRVRAYNASGTGANSNTITVSTTPPAPVATAATNITASSFSANWNTSTSATGYRLDVATDSGFTSYVTGYQNLDVGNVLTYSVNSNINAGTVYYYRVRGYNAVGTGANSNTIDLTTVPPAPTATAATNVLDESFSANWNAASGATGYYLDVAEDSGFTVPVEGFWDRNVGNVTTYSVAINLSSGTTYYYRLRAFNANGTSGNSNTISVSTVPGRPTAKAATNITAASFSANWNAVTGAAGYRLDVATDAAFTSYVTGWQNVDVGNVTTRSVNTNINGCTDYFYRVRAYNTGGTGINSFTITVFTAPDAPAATAATSITQTGFTANWNSVSCATSYYLDVAADSGFTSFVTGYEDLNVGNVTNYDVNANIDPGTTYYYRVRAHNNVGAGADSANSNTITVSIVPSNPVAAAATNVTDSSFSANWNSVTGVTGYYLDVATDAAFTSYVTGYQNLDVGNVTTYSVDTNINPGTPYYYRVRAYNSGGPSGNSNTITLTTAPTAPVATAATAIAGTSFSANWNASTGAAGYYLDVATDAAFTTYVTGWQNRNVGNVTTYSVNTNLQGGTTYYYRVRAYNATGTSGNSNTITVTTLNTVATLTTRSISAITAKAASSGGNITWNGGSAVTSRGVCWSTSHNPTTSNSKTVNGSGSGQFTSSITGLKENTTYYVRAYAVNAVGTAYGNELSFKTLAESTSVVITEPTDGATVSGTISIKATVTLSLGQNETASARVINKVEFYVDNVLLATDLSAPYETTWDTTKASTGNHTITAKAYNVLNNTSQDDITVIVYNVAPEMNLNRSKLYFATVFGTGPASMTSYSTAPQTFRVDNVGTGDMAWSLTSNMGSWLTVTPSSGTNSKLVTASLKSVSLAPKTYTGTITVTAPGAAGSPASISVVYRVYTPGTTQPPFGSFDTPENNSTVAGSLPVTGWVLDDIEVVSVKIYRAPVTGEGTNKVFIGDAVFVDGARSDIETSYPTYPKAYQAGWGYMMLTNFLPNKGNGTFTLYAIAKDKEGNEATLGQKTIICDNANAVKPFGTLDTPTQGGNAAGDTYVNFGWAVTPKPNTIPMDGSTINVWVNGVNLGNPIYNQYREDIFNLFGDLNNGSGAVGYYYLDTTAYENGVYTIGWSVKDNGGNEDGIGSRFFTIQNLSSSLSQGTGVSLVSHPFSRIALLQAPVPSSPVFVIKGFDSFAIPGIHTGDYEGVVTITLKETERLELQLKNDDTASMFGGYSVVENQYRPLPIGSTLDRVKGVFYWQPGPGFLGKHRLVFGQTTPSGTTVKKVIEVVIEPANRVLNDK